MLFWKLSLTSSIGIVKNQSQRIVNAYLCKVPYSEKSLKRLEKLCVDMENKKTYLNQYYAKRYSIVGAPLPDITFRDQEDCSHKLTEFKGKYLYIDIWASWCGPCCAEVPHFQKLEKETKNDKVVFVSISLDEKKKNWLEKIKQLNMSGNLWIVEDGRFADMLNIQGIPHFLLYGKDGNLIEYNAIRPSAGKDIKIRLDNLK